MNKNFADISLEDVARVKNALDPIDPQDYVTKAFGDANYSGSGSGYQKYFVQSAESYSIPIYISSVISGAFITDGSTEVSGKLEVI
jgi:hypothetical protein